ncbi:hypothetical protein [Exiguobacterium sp. AB2]|uniref:hypothetical protein n=1 Tax=Exiguobacterium sp. AB2 TaxID=1484479 RepID=UPI0004A96845|nr:hypothetical protein [Exiguobacterium sp. AB2]KDN57628.1 hypothetical protein DI14_10495 [Exiguobacterium sp. AB2]
MKLRMPSATNRKSKPVLIFKDGAELKECLSIQEAARWLKAHTSCPSIPYRHIMNGIIFDERWMYAGSSYRFTTDPDVKKEQLEIMQIQHKDRF